MPVASPSRQASTSPRCVRCSTHMDWPSPIWGRSSRPSPVRYRPARTAQAATPDVRRHGHRTRLVLPDGSIVTVNADQDADLFNVHGRPGCIRDSYRHHSRC